MYPAVIPITRRSQIFNDKYGVNFTANCYRNLLYSCNFSRRDVRVEVPAKFQKASILKRVYVSLHYGRIINRLTDFDLISVDEKPLNLNILPTTGYDLRGTGMIQIPHVNKG